MSPNRQADISLPSPWPIFLNELDRLLPHPIELHCLGGFVLCALYGLPRLTEDLDYIEAIPTEDAQIIEDLGGRGSQLAKKHKVYFQNVAGIADFPENYQQRLREIFPSRLSKLCLLALDLHDIVLSKLPRNHPVDDADVQFLIRRGVLSPSILQERYETELRPYLSNEERHDTTLKLWLEYFQELSP